MLVTPLPEHCPMRFSCVLGEAQQTAATPADTPKHGVPFCTGFESTPHSTRHGVHLRLSPAQPSQPLRTLGEKAELRLACRDGSSCPSVLSLLPLNLFSTFLRKKKQRRSLLCTRNADEVVREHFFIWTGVETRACLSRENLCLDVKPCSK